MIGIFLSTNPCKNALLSSNNFINIYFSINFTCQSFTCSLFTSYLYCFVWLVFSMQKCPPFIIYFPSILFLFTIYMPKTSHLLLLLTYLHFLNIIDFFSSTNFIQIFPPFIDYFSSNLVLFIFHMEFILVIFIWFFQELGSNEFTVCSSIFSTYVNNFKHEQVISIIITFHI